MKTLPVSLTLELFLCNTPHREVVVLLTIAREETIKSEESRIEEEDFCERSSNTSRRGKVGM